jgi:uncharacterized OB-fold protein
VILKLISEQFLRNLRRSRFAIPFCIRCGLPAWPPIDQCYFCMSRVKLRRIRSPIGSLIEYTTARNLCSPIIFGVIRTNGINLVGSLKSISPQIGMRVKMINCGVSSEGTPFYEFQKY